MTSVYYRIKSIKQKLQNGETKTFYYLYRISEISLGPVEKAPPELVALATRPTKRRKPKN